MRNIAYLFPVIALILFGCDNREKTHNENIAVVKQYVSSVESLDHDLMESLLADNYLGFGPSANDSTGKVAALENWKANIENLYESIKYTKSQFAGVTISEGPNSGNWVSNWSELQIGYQGDRGSVTIWANTNYKVENGKIVKSYTFYNEADVLRQLGYVFVNPKKFK